MSELINIKQKNNKYKCKISSKNEFDELNINDYKKYIGEQIEKDNIIELKKKYEDTDSVNKYYKCDLINLRNFKILQNIKLYDIEINNDFTLSSFFIAFFNHLYLLNPNLFVNEDIFLEQWDSNRELKFSKKYNNFDEEGEDTFQLGSKINSIKNILKTYDTEIIIYLLDNEGKKILKSFSINKSKSKCQMIYYGGLYYLVYDKINNNYFDNENSKTTIIEKYEKKLKQFLIEYNDLIKIKNNEFNNKFQIDESLNLNTSDENNSFKKLKETINEMKKEITNELKTYIKYRFPKIFINIDVSLET